MPTTTRKLSNKDRSWLALAAKVAALSEMNQRHGAVIVRGGRPLAVGINKFRNHPNQTVEERVLIDCSVHAEIDAMSKCDPTAAVLYVARLSRTDTMALSRPCGMCWDAMEEAGIKRVVWS